MPYVVSNADFNVYTPEWATGGPFWRIEVTPFNFSIAELYMIIRPLAELLIYKR